MIPFFIVSHNNAFLVKATVNSIRRFAPYNVITVLDNKSTDADSLCILNELKSLDNVIVRLYNDNTGPWRVIREQEFCNVRTKPFILTDPDLDLTKLPLNTLEILTKIQHKHNANKVGLALDISQVDDIIKGTYNHDVTVIQWESQFWTNKIVDHEYELYSAEIDTTFCLYNYSYPSRSIRVGGDFAVKHLPWHMSFIDSLTANLVARTFYNPTISTTSKLIWKYKKIFKAKDFIVVSDNQNDAFWGIYNGWETETFQVFDRFATMSQGILDIGSWIGPTVLYNASRYKHVWAVDADKGAIKSLTDNIEVNNFQNKVTVIPKAVYHRSGSVSFGNNLFLANSRENDSTSQIYENIEGGKMTECLSFDDLIKENKIDNLALIKVDIEGGEEFIMEQLLKYSMRTKTPIYLSFHFTWWKTKDLTKYVPYFLEFVCGDVSEQIKLHPFISILMQPKY